MSSQGELAVVRIVPASDARGGDLFYRRYSADGTPASGDVFLSNAVVNVFPLAVREDGSFLLVYSVAATPDSNQVSEQVRSRVFAPDGTPLGDPLLLLDGTSPGVRSSAVVPRPDGGFVVAWSDWGLKVYYRVLGPLGEPLGPARLLGLGFSVSLAASPGGEMVLVWRGGEILTTGREFIAAQRLRPDGGRAGRQFLVTPKLQKQVVWPLVTLSAGGDFLVTWTNPRVGLLSRRYNKNGAPMGKARKVARGVGEVQLAMDAQGDFAMVWTFLGEGIEGIDVVTKRFDRNGSPGGPVVLVNTYADGNQYLPKVASDGAGRFVVVWESDAPDVDQQGTFGRFFTLD
jgi:hypothetical protein